MQQAQEPRTVSVSRDQIRKLQERLEFIEDSRVFQDPDSPSSFGSAHVSHQALIPSSSKKPSRESRMQRNIRVDMSIPGSVFWLSTCPTSILQWFMKFGGIIGDSERRRNWEQWEWRTIATNVFSLLFGKRKGKTSERQKLSQVYGSPSRGYRDLYSKWHDKSEWSFLGDASGKIPRPYGISELDCELTNRGLLEGEDSQIRLAVAQGNRSSQIAGWPHHSKMNDRQRFPVYEVWIWWWRQHWKGVTISKHTSERRSVSRSRESSEGQPISQREANRLFDPWIFSTYRIL